MSKQTILASIANISSNYLPKTNGTVYSNSLIYDNGTNIGIGTTSPFAIADTNLTVNGTTSSAIQLGFNGTRYGQFYTDSGEIRLSAVANLPLTFYSNNLERMRISASGNVGIGISSPSQTLHIKAPSGSTTGLRLESSGGTTNFDILSSEGDGNVYLYQRSNYGILFGTNNTERLRITNTGDVKVQNNGNLALNGGCYILRNSSEVSYGYFIRTLGWKGGGNTDNTPAIAAEGGYGLNFYTNGTVDEKLRLYYDGYIALNSVVFGTTTSGTVRTLYIGNANYLLGGISSIRKSKTNIENVSNVDWIYDLNPVTFNYRKADENKNYTDEFYEDLNYGLIAEDTAPVADFLINYNDKEDGTKEMIGIEYPRLIVPLLKAIQELSAKVDAQQETINTLLNK